MKTAQFFLIVGCMHLQLSAMVDMTHENLNSQPIIKKIIDYAINRNHRADDVVKNYKTLGTFCQVNKMWKSYCTLEYHAAKRGVLLLGMRPGGCLYDIPPLAGYFMQKHPLSIKMKVDALFETDPEGNTTLMYAVASRNREATQWLLDCDVPINYRNKTGRSVFCHLNRILERTDLTEKEKNEYARIQTVLLIQMRYIEWRLQEFHLPHDIVRLIKELC